MTAPAPEATPPEEARSPRKWFIALGGVGAVVLLFGGVAIGTSLSGGAQPFTSASETPAASSSSAPQSPAASSDAAQVGLVLRVTLSEATVTVYPADNLDGRGQSLAVLDYDALSSLTPGQFEVDGVAFSDDGDSAIVGLSDGSSVSVTTLSLVTATASLASSDPQAIVGATVVVE